MGATEIGLQIASSVVSEKVVYAATMAGRVFVLEGQSRKAFCATISSQLVSSLLIANGTIVGATFDSWMERNKVNGENEVFALDTESGEPKWTFKTEGYFFSSPCLVGDSVVIGSTDGKVYSIGNDGNAQGEFGTF